MTNTKCNATTHKERSDTEDISSILEVLKLNNPWDTYPGRKLPGFWRIDKSPYIFDKTDFDYIVMSAVERLKRGQVLGVIGEDEEDSDEDEL